MRRSGKRSAGSMEAARKAAGVDHARSERGRFSSRRKGEAVLRVLRGESIDVVSRELGVTAGTLSGWRDSFLAAGCAGLKSRRTTAEAEEVRRLRSKVGELTMDIEVWEEIFRRRGIEVPFELRRSRT